MTFKDMTFSNGSPAHSSAATHWFFWTKMDCPRAVVRIMLPCLVRVA